MLEWGAAEVPIATDDLWVSVLVGPCLMVLSRPTRCGVHLHFSNMAKMDIMALQQKGKYDKKLKWRNLLCGGCVGLPRLGCNILLSG